MKKLLILIIIPVLATIAISAASLLLPQPPGAADGAYYNPLGTSITLIDMGLSISAGILFFRARRNFKPELRPAYRFLAAATLATGILNIDFPITEYYSLWSNFYFDAASYLPYFAGGILMFLGMRQFYRFINTGQRTWVTNIPLLLAITIVVWALYVLNTHLINAWGSEAQHDWMQIVVLVPVTGYAAACYMALRTWSRLGHAYRLALGWLTIALLAYTFDVTMVLVQEIIGYDNWFFNTRAYEIPIILADILALGAGYYLNQIGQARQPWLRRLLGRHTEPATSLDIVVYAAGLAASPIELEDPLNKMRVITARAHTGEAFALTDDDQRVLKEVYLSVEQYLISSDRLRSYGQSDLRQAITERFDLGHNAGSTFWPQLG